MVSFSASSLLAYRFCIALSRCRCSRRSVTLTTGCVVVFVRSSRSQHISVDFRSSPKSAMFTNTRFDVVTIHFVLIPLDGISSQQSPKDRWIDETHGNKWSYPTNGGVLPSVTLGVLCASFLPKFPGRPDCVAKSAYK